MPKKENLPQVPEIDLNNISNVGAGPVEKMKIENTNTVLQRKTKGRFNFTEPEEVLLPSGGFLYNGSTTDENVLKGKILLYPMTAREEEILSTQRFVKDGTVTRRVLDRCIVSDIDAKDILVYDSNYLLFFLRQISYGDDYNFELKCQNEYCEKKFEHIVKISELNFKELNEDFDEPIEIKLPRSNYTVNLVLPRLYHSEIMADLAKKRKTNFNEGNKETIDKYVATTVSILDNKNKEISRKYWEEFYESLPGIDIAEIRKKSNFSSGVDELNNVICPYCGSDYSGTIPIDINFFRF